MKKKITQPQYIECLEIEKCNMMLSHDDQGVSIINLTFFDCKTHTIEMLLLLLDPIQKFCLKMAKIENC